MLGGFLAGLSNLGQVYAGYQREQEANLIQQMNRERLLEAQQQRQQQVDLGKLIGAGGFGPLQSMTPQPIPQPGVQQPGAFPSSQPGQVPSYPLTPPPTPTQLAAAGPLGLLGIPGGGPLGVPGLPGMSGFGGGGPTPSPLPPLPPPLQTTGLGNLGVGSPFGPGQPMGGLAPTGVGLPPPSLAQAPVNPAGTGPAETADAGGLTGPQWGPDVNMFTATLGRPDPTRGGIVQPAGGFGMPPGYERPSVGGGPDEYLRPRPTVPGTADTGGTAQVPGTADTSGRVSLPNVQNAVFGIESNYGRDPSAAVPNRAGAVGPMQVTPKDYPQYDADRLVNDPQYNYAAGNEIIAGLYRKYGGNPDLVAIGYNAGESKADAVRDGRMSVNALPDETKRYLVNMHRRLGLPPPPGLDSGVGSAYAGMNRSASPQEHGAGNYGAEALLRAYPQMPRVVSSFETANQLAQMINQRLPGASDEEKGGVFLKLFPMMSQAAKEDTAQQWDRYNAEVGQLKEAERIREFEETKDIERRKAGMPKYGPLENFSITDPATGTQRTVMGSEVTYADGRRALVDFQNRPIAADPSQIRRVGEREAGGGLEASHMFEYRDKDGVMHQVMLREARDRAGWVDSDTGKPWTKPEGATGFKQVTAGVAGGGRAGAQLQRQLIAGGEVTRDLQNVQQLPVGTTTGLFGNVKPGVTLGGALTSDLTTQLTTEDEINMKQAFAGVGRELSTLMSPVYGGNWASEQLEPLIPKAGYTINNALMGIARIKQSAIVALQALQTSPIVSAEEKDLAKEYLKQIDAAIPWDVAKVIAFTQSQNPQESFGEYAGRTVSAPAGQQPAAPGATPPPSAAPSGDSIPVPDNKKNDPDGRTYTDPRTGEIWVKQGDQLVKQSRAAPPSAAGPGGAALPPRQ